MKEKVNYPMISIVTCTYNGDRVIEEYMKGIFSQNYPLKKIELILNDGGSKDNTINIINEFKKRFPKNIKLLHNEKQYSIGKGFGMDNATRKAKGEIIVQLDQDNILTQKDWIKTAVEILIKHPEITAVQSRLFVPKNGTLLDKYLNATGIEDPFAWEYSLNAQITLNPCKFEYNKSGKFHTYKVNYRNFYYAGDNGFAIRKKEFLENGGYTQDIDNFSRMAKSGKKYIIAVPIELKLHHKTSTGLRHYLSKKIFNVGHYLTKNYENRDFYWFNLQKNTLRQNFRFIKIILFNLLIIPGIIQGGVMAVKKREGYWIIHPVIIFLITCSYIYSYLYSKLFKKNKEIKV